jgi:hypothetical protein
VVVADPSLPAQGYRLRITEAGVAVDAADAAGAFYAAATLAQLHAVSGASLPGGEVEDWPDFPVRGVMLDVSRDKVPTLDELIDVVVPKLAGWKVNHLELYMEHTFAYSGHETVWAEASPFTAAEIRTLDAACRRHHIELAANQNCLGHWERWLRHDRYRRLALNPDGSPLEEPANALVTPNPAKAPWYFLWLQEIVTDTTIHLGSFTINGAFLGGVVLPGLLVTVLIAWPWLDRSSRGGTGVWLPAERRTQNIVFLIVVALILVFTFIGLYLRGPYWNFYWPWEAWPDIPSRL